MTSPADHTPGTGPEPPADPHHRLARLLRSPEPAPTLLIRALLAELEARETRAYASGWQDAVEALTCRGPGTDPGDPEHRAQPRPAL